MLKPLQTVAIICYLSFVYLFSYLFSYLFNFIYALVKHQNLNTEIALILMLKDYSTTTN